jgi:hypothetical protein
MDAKLHRKWRIGKSPLNSKLQFESPSVMDFTLQDALRVKSFQQDDSWDKEHDNFTNDYLYANPNNILVFAENHDTNRFNEIYQRYSKMGLAWLGAWYSSIILR